MKPTISPESYLQETIELKIDLEKNFIVLAEHLYKIYSEKLWQEAGRVSWDEFLMEVKISVSAASKLISVYKKYVVEHKIPISKLASVRSWEGLYSVAKLAVDRDTALELVEAGAVESDKDMRAKVKGEKDCDRHEWIEYRFCRKCGVKEKIYDNC